MIAGSHGPNVRLPEPSILNGWLEQLTRWGYRSVRTTALSPELAAAFAQLGFFPVQELALLSAVLLDTPELRARPSFAVRTIRRVPSRPYPTRIAEVLLRIDRSAFGEDWCMDPGMFDESRTATRRSRLFAAIDQHGPAGFITVGATGPSAFLQRLAVDPKSQRQGMASHLVSRSLQWARRVGCSHAVVNTATTNVAALDLYRSFGFTPMDQGLSVMERSLP